MIFPIYPIYLIEQIIYERINNPRKEKKGRHMHHMFIISLLLPDDTTEYSVRTYS
jgi:hypothetical protein